MLLARFIEDSLSVPIEMKRLSKVYQPPKLFLILLIPLSWVYTAVIWLRNFLYDHRIFRVYQLPVMIISVGNISCGGTGKTPAVEWLANQLLLNGFKVGILSRGYKRKSKTAIIVSNGNKIFENVTAVGDEPYLLALNLPGVPIVVDADRVAGATLLIEKFKPDFVILDDGFQHRRLGRQLDLVLLDAQAGLDQKVLPAGLFREPISAIKRAGMVWITKSPENRSLQAVKAALGKISNVPIFTADYKVIGVVDSKGIRQNPAVFSGKRILAFCGIANPAGFYHTLAIAKIVPASFIRFPDHHSYSQHDLALIKRRSKELKCDLIITTQKDFVRIATKEIPNMNLSYLAVKFEVNESERVIRLIIDQCMT